MIDQPLFTLFIVLLLTDMHRERVPDIYNSIEKIMLSLTISETLIYNLVIIISSGISTVNDQIVAYYQSLKTF